MNDRDVRAVQRYYPQIYFACRVDHVRSASTEHRLSSRDSGVLSHLDEARPTAPWRLARHLGVGASTLSALLDRLVDLGHVARRRSSSDGRRWELRLTRHGAAAMVETSVLDANRVRSLLERLTPGDRKRAIEGMELLARAAAREARP